MFCECVFEIVFFEKYSRKFQIETKHQVGNEWKTMRDKHIECALYKKRRQTETRACIHTHNKEKVLLTAIVFRFAQFFRPEIRISLYLHEIGAFFAIEKLMATIEYIEQK